ncbi:MAG: carbohydrate kinase family protein [Treponema sp.]|nr:carbohydrate kinase family protein [Treponema sp.]
MKKGYIARKDYVVKSSTYVAVIGGINIDIGGITHKRLVIKDSNPGTVTISLGGVACNIAHNLSLLGMDVQFFTALGDDDYAQRIESACNSAGIDISHALRVKNAATSMYLFISDSDGDMACAVSDMDIYKHITSDYLAGHMPLLNNAQLVVIDTNVPQKSLEYLARHCTAPIFADPVSIAKAPRLYKILSRVNTLKPNRLEAELLSGRTITGKKTLFAAADALLAHGVQRVFISLGKDGVLAADGAQKQVIPCCPAKVVNVTGSGDAFMAALAYAYVHGAGLEEAARMANAAAAIAAESAQTINLSLSPEKIMERMKRIKRCGGE